MVLVASVARRGAGRGARWAATPGLILADRNQVAVVMELTGVAPADKLGLSSPFPARTKSKAAEKPMAWPSLCVRRHFLSEGVLCRVVA